MFSFSMINSLLLISALCKTGVKSIPECNNACTREYQPVCGTLKSADKSLNCTFPNECLFKLRKCEHQEDWSIKTGVCFKDSEECPHLLNY
uniref:Kazal-like domain-containing protein n=1 Tax=Glossina brevipalpis TaxID=37001 RepID=A0A1A9WNQ5_9MUSC